MKKYGTDAVRFTLASMASPGTNVAFNIARTEGYRAFANKIWNAARFIFMNVDRAAEIGIKVDPAVLGSMPTAAGIYKKADESGLVSGHDFSRAATPSISDRAADKVNQSLENYRYDDAANEIYQFFWGSFCDWYLEIVKLRLDFSETADKAQTSAALTTLVSVFEASLRLLSPFMPFITEEIWHAIYDGNPPAKSIALTRFPTGSLTEQHKATINTMHTMQALIETIRALRKDVGVAEKETVPVELRIELNLVEESIEANLSVVERLARVSEVRFVSQISAGLKAASWFFFDVAVVYERTIDVAAERDRLTKDIARYEKGVAAAERQLGNEAFLAKAPAQVVEGLKKQEAETRQLLEKARIALNALLKDCL